MHSLSRSEVLTLFLKNKCPLFSNVHLLVIGLGYTTNLKLPTFYMTSSFTFLKIACNVSGYTYYTANLRPLMVIE